MYHYLFLSTSEHELLGIYFWKIYEFITFSAGGCNPIASKFQLFVHGTKVFVYLVSDCMGILPAQISGPFGFVYLNNFFQTQVSSLNVISNKIHPIK